MFLKVVSLLPDKGGCAETYEMGDLGADATYDDCMYNEMEKLMEAELGCTVPFLPSVTNICTKEDQRKAAFGLYQASATTYH